MRRLVFAGLWTAAILGCEEKPVLPPGHPARQRTLSERLIAEIPRAKHRSPDERADVALALAEVVMPTQAGRLRLAVAGDDPVVAHGAAVALARIIRRREGGGALITCWEEDTNPFVRTSCLDELRLVDPKGLATLVAAVDGQWKPELFARKAELLAEVVQPPAARPVVPLLESDDPEQRREGLRLLLTLPTAGEGESRLESGLVHALTDPDGRVVMLASALFLRRSLSVSPPPIDAAVPDGRTP